MERQRLARPVDDERILVSTDQEKNLKVLTEHILDLAARQQTAVDQITGANRSIVDPARNVQDTHGMICEAPISRYPRRRRHAGPLEVHCSRSRRSWARNSMLPPHGTTTPTPPEPTTSPRVSSE